jgi:membrane protein implicated in regulation of membrane protease activity
VEPKLPIISVRLLFIIRLAAATAVTIAGVLAWLAVPNPLVPGVEGLLLIGLLVWGQLEFASRRKESVVYRQHVGDIRAFARLARDTGLFMSYASGGMAQVVNAIPMTGARAQDFRSHYSEVADQIDEWNRLANGYVQASHRFLVVTHREAEQATNDRTTGLPVLLGDYGRGDVELSDMTWRVENNRLEASYQVTVMNEPAWRDPQKLVHVI